MTPSPPPKVHAMSINLVQFQQGLSMIDSCSSTAPKQRLIAPCTRRAGRRASIARPVRGSPALVLSPRAAGLLPVPILPSSDDAAQWHDLRGHQTAAGGPAYVARLGDLDLCRLQLDPPVLRSATGEIRRRSEHRGRASEGRANGVSQTPERRRRR